MFRDHLRVATVAMIAAAFFTGGSAVAASTSKAGMKDLGELTCKDVMRLSGEDRQIALAFAHGYVLGKKGKTQYNVDALAQITDKFIDHCLDNPKANALGAFEKIAH